MREIFGDSRRSRVERPHRQYGQQAAPWQAAEGQARRLIAFFGAPWDDRCFNFHQQDRAVQTPSRWQVRQPIYSNSVGRWKRYRAYLPELETAFAEIEGR